MKTYCVYAHRKASTGEVFYIGKGGRHRPASKIGRSIRWHRTVAKHGLQIEIIKSDMPEPCAFTLEKALIHSIGRDKLCNLTDGGEGTSGRVASEAQRRKCSASNKGTKPAPHSIELARAKNSKPVGTRCGLRFESATDAARFVHPQNVRAAKVGISHSALGRVGPRYGYEWGYIKDGEPLFLFSGDRSRLLGARVKRAVKADELQFTSAGEAEKWLKSNGHSKARASAITRSVKTGLKAYGHRWHYV